MPYGVVCSGNQETTKDATAAMIPAATPGKGEASQNKWSPGSPFVSDRTLATEDSRQPPPLTNGTPSPLKAKPIR
eukprot:705976-Prorocentrum_lima.AAC.1